MAEDGLREAVAGRLFSAGARTFVLSLSLPTSLPIPLGTTAPGLDLVTWAFAGLDPADAAGPRALLVLAARDGTVAARLRDREEHDRSTAPGSPDLHPHPEVPERSEGLEGGLQQGSRFLEPSFDAAGTVPQDEGSEWEHADSDLPVFRSNGQGARIGLTTHYRDLAVSTNAAEPLDALSADDRTLITRALLSAAAPDTVAALGDLIALFEGAMIAPADDAPEIALTGDTGRISGSVVPDYLLVRRESGWACLRVARARLAFGAEPHADLTLAPVWGPPGGAVEAAILLSPQSFTPARIGTAR